MNRLHRALRRLLPAAAALLASHALAAEQPTTLRIATVAYANAVADALAPLGIDVTSLPLHGEVLHQLLTDDRKDA